VDALTILLIAVGLAMDAFAVSIANGMTITSNRRRSALMTAAFFGGFQMLMPAIGWVAGLTLAGVISGIDHWIAFGLLAFIGAKMIYEATKKDEDQKCSTDLKLHALLILAVATSIDALMVGLSFAFLQTSIIEPIAVIGAVTFGLSFIGFYFGCGLGKRFGHRIEIVGGFVLIIIGFRILLEHLLV
jgi:manganese efflux pump family protein